MTTPTKRQQQITNIDAWLPQTQCGRCGFPRCIDYARAIRDEETDINRCPPGGETTLQQLSNLLDKRPLPLDPECGHYQGRLLAVIVESRCIGCTLCIQACPVDAIVGSGKMMHTVIADECTGCELCLPPCPVDCIRLEPPPVTGETDSPWPQFSRQQINKARLRSAQNSTRPAAARNKRLRKPRDNTALPDRDSMQQDILAAVRRQRLKHPH